MGVKENLIETLAEPFPDITRKYVLLNKERIDRLYIEATKYGRNRALEHGLTYKDGENSETIPLKVWKAEINNKQS